MAKPNSSPEAILYDIPSKGDCGCWSLNPWKTRLALNFKGIPYRTQWVEYPDIEALLKSLNIPPHPDSPHYTIPAITLPTGESLQDSLLIAKALDALYPSPSLRLDAPILPEVQAAVTAALRPLRPDLLPLVPPTLLNTPSSVYFTHTRSLLFGQPLSTLRASRGGDVAWENARAPVAALAALVEGPFVLGGEVSYADFVVAGFLVFVRKAGGEEAWKKIIELDEEGRLRGVYEGCAEWLGRGGV